MQKKEDFLARGTELALALQNRANQLILHWKKIAKTPQYIGKMANNCNCPNIAATEQT